MTESLHTAAKPLAVTLVLSVVLHSGCDIPPRPILQPVKVDTDPSLLAADLEEADVFDPPVALQEPAWETWDAYFVGGSQVGYSHVTATPLEQAADSEIRYELEDRLYINYGRARILQRLTQTSDESRDGQLLRCTGQLQVGPTVTRFEGSMDETEFVVDTIRGSSRRPRKIPWEVSNRGLVALEQSIRAKPMLEAGEKRKLRMLVPGRYVVATATMRCAGEASVPMIDGQSAKVIEINCEIEEDEEKKSYSTIWTDFAGNIVRTYSPTLQLVGYRTDEATATGFPGNELVAAAIGVKGKQIERPSQTVTVAYEATPIRSDPEKPAMIQPAPGQYVRTKEDGSFQVLVTRGGERPKGGFTSAILETSKEDLGPNFFVDHGEALIKRPATAAVVSNKVPKRDAALALTETTNRWVTPTIETLGFVKASEVARDGKGDSTAAAIMLAAMLRAQGIPSRLALGLKYAAPSDQQPSTNARLIFHVWTLAFVDGDWLHLDAFEGGAAGADRIVLATTNLSGGDEYGPVASLLQTLGQMDFKIVASVY